MSNNPLSTFKREMQDPAFKKQFEEEYKGFLLPEIIRELVENSQKSVIKLANESGLSTTDIQNLLSGVQEDMKLTNFLSVTHACGYNIVLEKNGRTIYL